MRRLDKGRRFHYHRYPSPHMSLLDRYLLGEIIGPTIAALLAFTVLIVGHVLFTVVDVVAGKGVRLESILYFASLRAPEAAVLALPVSVLLGCSLALNRLASDNELLPLFAGGVGAFRLLRAPIFIGLVATAASLALKEYAVPSADREGQRLFREMLMRQKSLAFKPNRFVDTGARWVFIARDVDQDNERLTALRALMKRPGQFPIVMRAQTARFSGRTLWAEDVNLYEFSFPDKLNCLSSPSLSIDLGGIGGTAAPAQTLQNRSLRQLLSERAAQRSQGPIAVRELDMEIHGRLSLSLACLVFAILAAPVALRFGRGQSLAGVLATLVVAFVYFLVMLAFRLLGSHGTIPVPVAAWTQNAILLALALLAMRRL